MTSPTTKKGLRWREFGEVTEFVRLIVQQRDNWEMTFTSPMAFALSPQEILRMPGGWDHLWVGGDASGSEARMGDVVAAIDYDAQTWQAEHMDVYAGALASGAVSRHSGRGARMGSTRIA